MATIDVTLAPYFADPTGVADVSVAVGNAIAAAVTSVDEIYFPAGVYKFTSAISHAKALRFRGQRPSPAKGNPIAIWNTTLTGATQIMSVTANVVCVFENISFASTTSPFLRYPINFTTSSGVGIFRRCTWIGFTTAAFNGQIVSVDDCDFISFGCRPVWANNLQMSNSRLQSGATSGTTLTAVNLSFPTGSTRLTNCLVIGSITVPNYGASNGVLEFDKCTLIAENPSSVPGKTAAFTMVGGQRSDVVFKNTLICNSAGYGIDNQAATPTDNVTAFNCAFWNNASGNAHSTVRQVNCITLTANPFVDEAGADYRINNTPGGGALLRHAGWAIPDMNLDVPDIGAGTSNFSGAPTSNAAFILEEVYHIFHNTNISLIGDTAGLRGSATIGTLKISLHNDIPDGGNQTTDEGVAGYTTYARQEVVRGLTGFSITDTGAGIMVTNVGLIQFPAFNGGAGGLIRYVGIGTDLTGPGKLLTSGPLDTTKVVVVGSVLEFQPGALHLFYPY